MKNLAQASVVLVALLGASGGLAVAAIGCGGDDTSVSNEDAQSDVAVDQTSPFDASADAKPDHKGDATDKDVVGSDVVEKDAKDKDVEQGDSEVTDAEAAADAPVDAAALFAFPNEVNKAYCERIAQCCGFDGGAGFNVAQCIADNVSAGGFDNVSVAQVDSGNIALDDTAAATCLNNLKEFNCATVQDPQYASTLIACSTAMQGLVGANAGSCTTYWDCTAGNYCVKTDGGSHCVPLVAEGGPCVDTTYSTDCTYRGAGNPPRFCSPAGDGSTGECDMAQPLSAGCSSNLGCVSEICDPGTPTATDPGSCQNSSAFTDPGVPGGFCAGYTLDAGP